MSNLDKSSKRIHEIAGYAVSHGDKKTLNNYNITPETLARYKRAYKYAFQRNQYNVVSGVIAQMEVGCG